MTMKKSLIALAVSSAVVAPASVQAAEVYGAINTTYESTSTGGDGGVGYLIFNTTSDDGDLGQSDTFGSRFGITGDEDLGNGLTAGYTFEFDVGTSAFGGGGSPTEDSVVSTRLSNISLSGDFGKVKVGTMWGVLYSYAGWNNYRTDGHGGSTHYYMSNGTNLGDMAAPVGFFTDDNPSALRVDRALQYTWGGGGYSSDPFTFTVQLRSVDEGGQSAGVDLNGDGDFDDSVVVGPGGVATTASPADNQTVIASDTAPSDGDEEAIDNVTVGAQGTIAGVTLNATYYQESNTEGPEPSRITLGGRWSPGPFFLGATYYLGDRDQENDDVVGDNPSAINVLGGMDFGGGFSGYLGLGAGFNDTDDAPGNRSDDYGDMQTAFLQLQEAFSSRTKIYGELEYTQVDDVNGTDADPEDGEQTTLAVGLKHSF